ncbi:GNAT family N-acetyltransferase [Maribacter sp. CXY002]|uniref:GNAT family N-acetyltransferase n=1 Tax=Maribacter luteocoastalis TaxID=3407671 RepID=UPI003B68195A
MYKELETERLRIRPINVTDAAFIKELVNSKGWLKFIGDKNISTIIDAERYIQKILDNPHFYYSIFELKTSGEPIGIVTFLNRENQNFPDIGFALLPDFEKNGYTIEAIKKYIEALLGLGIHKKIIAITLPNNHKSIKLLTKLGLNYEYDFEKEGETLSLFSLSL